ncbi:MAG: PAS domain S-box protein [Vicinamibacteraceae bacterium]
MASDGDEEARLRGVALQNAQSILVARRRAEEALRQQSQWLRITLASIGDAVITTDVEGRVTSMNAVAQVLTGWSQSDALGLFLTEVLHIIHEDTRQAVENSAIRALQTSTIIRLANHTVLLARTGEEHPIDDSAAPIRDESGATVGAVLVFRDVSERKAADVARAHLAAIVESSEDAIISKTLQGIILSWNKGAEHVFGYAANEAIGRPVTMLLPPERLDEEQHILAQIARGDRIEHFETVRVGKHGRRLDVSLTVSPIRDASGQIVGASKVARDISRRKTVEARDRFLIALDDALRQHSEAEAMTLMAARALGEHLGVNRCAYARVEEDEDTFLLTGNFTRGVDSIVGRYTFRQFGEECLRLMRAGEPYVVADSALDPRITAADHAAYQLVEIGAVICVPIKKQGRFVAAMAVHTVGPRAWEASDVELVQRVAGRSWESIERARVTHELRESEHLFRALANSNPNLTWMARPDGWIYWYNDQWYAYTGTTPVDMEGWGWERVHDPATLPIVKQRWLRSIESGTPFEMVFPLRGADGTFRRFLTRVNPVHDSRGHIVHWFGTNTDVESERQTADANAELRERERLVREDAELQKRLLYSLFMQAPTSIAVLRGPNHVVELANPLVCEVWGHQESEVLNRPLLDVLTELRDQIFPSLLDEVFRTGVPYVGKETATRLTRRDGPTEIVYFNFVYSPFRNVEGDIEGVFVIASDVTDQVLARHQLDDLREAAESANRAKDEFLAMLGHELRNPLSPILTALQLMKLRGIDGAERERTVIERQVRHLTRLVDDLLDVSRIARGRVELKEGLIEVAEVVAKAIEMAGPLLDQRTHALDVDVPRRGLTVKGDSIRLSQVVSNLVTNAAKYTSPGGQITIRGNEEGDQVVLRVRDTGMGIAPDVLPRVFDLFVQERQAIDRSQGGLGLGLTIVRNLVEQHGGTVSAHSNGPGTGSEFVVRLPKANVAAMPGDRLALEPVDGRVIAPVRDPVRILVVDDSVDAAEMLAGALSAKGYETRIAHDAPGALRVAADFRPAIAFLDLGLPVMDGYELAARLRGLPELNGLRLIALTGYGQDSDRNKTRDAGFQHHLVKPVELEAIEAVLGDG